MELVLPLVHTGRFPELIPVMSLLGLCSHRRHSSGNFLRSMLCVKGAIIER